MKLNHNSVSYGIATVEDLELIESPLEGDTVVVTEEGRGGVFIYRADGTSNGGTIFDSSSTGKWHRQYDGAVNVKWFGAKGDGVTNNRIMINNALEYIHLCGGGTLYIPTGDYKIGGINGNTEDKYIKIYSDTTIVGEQEGTTRLIRDSVFSIMSTRIFNSNVYDTNKNISIRNITFDGNSANYQSPANLVYIEECTGVEVINCHFIDTPGLHALDLVVVKDVYIDRCTFLGTDLQLAIDYGGVGYYPEAIQLSFGDIDASTYAENVIVSNCVFDKSDRVGSDYFYTAIGNHTTDNSVLAHMKNIRIINNTIIGCSHSGVRANLCDGFYVDSNTFRNVSNAFAIWSNLHLEYGLFNNKNIKFSNNLIDTYINSGVYNTGPSYTTTTGYQTTDNIEISNNIFLNRIANGSTAHAISLTFANNVKIHGNSIKTDDITARNGILLNFPAKADISGNIINRSATTNIWIIESTHTDFIGQGITRDITISDNQFYNAQNRGIHLNCLSKNVLISNNLVHNANLSGGNSEAIKVEYVGDNAVIFGNKTSYDSIPYTYGVFLSHPLTSSVYNNYVQIGSSGASYSTAPNCNFNDSVVGSPEGVISAGIGSIAKRLDGGAGTTLYVKESGTGKTGWVAK